MTEERDSTTVFRGPRSLLVFFLQLLSTAPLVAVVTLVVALFIVQLPISLCGTF